MKIKSLKQRDSEACGPTSIKMVVNYFDLHYTLKDIAKISNYKKREGLSNKELVDVLKKLGLKVKHGHNTNWSDLRKYNNDKNVIVLSWMFRGYIGHFSILEKISKTHIYIADPRFGKITKMQKIIFMRLWFDYDELWFPKKSSDIKLRWMAIVSK